MSMAEPAARDLLLACEGLSSYFRNLYEGWIGAEQLRDTPYRLARMYREFCWPPDRIQKELDRQFRLFEQTYDAMLVTNPIEVWVLCPHHLLPGKFRVIIGYIPRGKVLGLSKFSRIAITMGKRPIMQEQYTIELADELERRLDPKGVAVYVSGRHGCMVSRGVRQSGPITTSVIKGAFEDHPTREEFYAIARNSK